MVFISVLDYERLRDKERAVQKLHRNDLRTELRAEQVKEIEVLQEQITPSTSKMEDLELRLARVEGVHAWIDKLMTPLIGDLVDIGTDSRIRVLETLIEKLRKDQAQKAGKP